MNTDLPEHLPPAPDARQPGGFRVWLWTQARRVVIFVVGMTILLIGIAMIVLPGPATIVIPLGLAVLATEFVWARKWLEYARRKVQELANQAVSSAQSQSDASDKR